MLPYTNGNGDQSRGKREVLIKGFCNMETGTSFHPDGARHPLLRDADETESTLIQKAISLTFKSTAYLAGRLPTGTVLVFQLLSPIFTDQGDCDTVRQYMTGALLILCGLSCFFLCFSDSFKDDKGTLHYGFATIKGLWVIDGATLTTEAAAAYRLRFVDFLHAFLSLLVFAAIAFFDSNVVNCFFSSPSDEVEEILTCLPVGIGVICSGIFVLFPTTRHGIGFTSTTSK